MHLLSVNATNCRSTALIFYYQILAIQIDNAVIIRKAKIRGILSIMNGRLLMNFGSGSTLWEEGWMAAEYPVPSVCSRPGVPYSRTLSHNFCKRFTDTGMGVFSSWLNREMRSSSICQRNNSRLESVVPA